MSNAYRPRSARWLGVSSIGGVIALSAAAAPPLSGAIFPTTDDGSVVSENVRYDAKEDAYLDIGPGPMAPASAAGRPAGHNSFQVSDPNGKDLLSTDRVSSCPGPLSAARSRVDWPLPSHSQTPLLAGTETSP